MKQSIAILTGSHLCHNPRVLKEATALQAAGYDVEVLGGWFDSFLKARDQELMAKIKFRFRPLHDLTEQKMLRLGLRLRGRLANLIRAKTGYENHWQLGYFVSALTKAARQSKADLLIAHSEQALWAVAQLQNRKSEIGNRKFRGASPFQLSAFSFQNFRIGVDMEDWFSEDLPPETRRHRPVKLLRRLEQKLLQSAVHTTCTSEAMSRALAAEYGCRPPAVVYNAFPWSDRQLIDGKTLDRRDLRVPSVHWYSQTLGTDRGLGDLFVALPLIKKEFEIHLRGKPADGFENWLAASVPESWRKRVFLHPLVSNEELLSRIAEHDMGIAGEQKYCKNKEFTVSNKILHYLLGGLAVVASDMAGQKEIAANSSGAVLIYRSGDAASLANELNTLLATPELMRAFKVAALAAAETEFCWERQVPVLLKSVKQALAA